MDMVSLASKAVVLKEERTAVASADKEVVVMEDSMAVRLVAAMKVAAVMVGVVRLVPVARVGVAMAVVLMAVALEAGQVVATRAAASLAVLMEASLATEMVQGRSCKHGICSSCKHMIHRTRHAQMDKCC